MHDDGEQLELPLEGGDWMESVTIVSAISQGISTIGDTMELFMKAPGVYFVALALVSAAAGVSRKFIPMKRK